MRSCVRLIIILNVLAALSCNDSSGPTDNSGPTAAGTGAVSGTIVDDRGSPLANARLVANSPAKNPKETISAADGSFALNGLAAGDWTVRVDERGYSAEAVTVRIAGGSTQTLSPIVVRLISGDIRGVIRLGDTNAPATGVVLTLLRSGSQLQSTTSGLDGSFVIADVPVGASDIIITAPPDYRGDTTIVNLHTRVLDLTAVSLMRVSGTVTGAVRYADTRTPVANVVVRLSNGVASFPTISDGDGKFVIAHVPFGVWTLIVESGAWHDGASVVVALDRAELGQDMLLTYRADPTARYLVYASCDGGSFWEGCWGFTPAIRIVDEKGNRDRPLASFPVDVYDPAWAPGRMIALVWGGQLSLMDPAGTGLTPLTEVSGYVTTPAWSPDGSKLALTVYPAGPGDTRIYIIESDGSDLRAVTGGPVDTEPTWSPDGSRIAFNTCGVDQCDVAVVNADGSNRVVLTSSAADEVMYFSPNWAPDGSYIAVSSCPRNGQCEIGLVDATTGSLTSLKVPGTCPVWSPDGQKIAVVGDASIQIISRTGQPVISIPTPTLYTCRVAWSP